jgi:hypothetical protein
MYVCGHIPTWRGYERDAYEHSKKCIYVPVKVYVCVCVCVLVYLCPHTYVQYIQNAHQRHSLHPIHIYMHTYIRSHTPIQTYIQDAHHRSFLIHTRTKTQTYICTYIHTQDAHHRPFPSASSQNHSQVILPSTQNIGSATHIGSTTRADGHTFQSQPIIVSYQVLVCMCVLCLVYLCLCLRVCTCVYVYVCIYTYTYTRIIHTYL